MTGLLTAHSGLGHEAKAYVRAGRGVVVDINGRGDFTAIHDAVGYWKGRGIAGRIWVRNGTYNESVDVDAPVHIEGESWDVVINGDTDHAIQTVHDGPIIIENMSLKTTGGGGNSAYPILVNSGTGSKVQIHNVNITDADSACVLFNDSQDGNMISNSRIAGADLGGVLPAGSFTRVGNCWIQSNGGDGMDLDGGNTDNAMVIGCVIKDNAGWGVIIGSNDENCVVVGNRVEGNSSGNISDSSGTSTVTGNDTT